MIQFSGIQLRKLGIEPQAIEQPLDMSIPESKIMLAIYLAAPKVENDRRALNVIAGMRKAMKEGRHVNMAPKGYRNSRDENNNKIISPGKDAKAIYLTAGNVSRYVADTDKKMSARSEAP
jgi:site-specific DNA recombinase